MQYLVFLTKPFEVECSLAGRQCLLFRATLFKKKSRREVTHHIKLHKKPLFFFYPWLFIYIDNFRVILKIDDAALSNQCMRRNAQVRLIG